MLVLSHNEMKEINFYRICHKSKSYKFKMFRLRRSANFMENPRGQLYSTKRIKGRKQRKNNV